MRVKPHNFYPREQTGTWAIMGKFVYKVRNPIAQSRSPPVSYAKYLVSAVFTRRVNNITLQEINDAFSSAMHTKHVDQRT